MGATHSHTILDPHVFASLMAQLGPFESNPAVAVAVSGGADSMALTLLAQRWAQMKGGHVEAITIDHGLRSQSSDEARQVHEWCVARGISHHILTMPPLAQPGSVQEQAREVRYKMLTDWCKRHNILHLLTAHHQGDQAETLFFRLARGSGLSGLAGISPLSAMHGIRLLRPLLAISKKALNDFLDQNKQPWIEDPTNLKDDYTRNRIRKKIAETGISNNIISRANTLVSRLTCIRNSMEYNTFDQLTSYVSIFPQGYASANLDVLTGLPPDHAIRLLSCLITTVDGNIHPPRSHALERLYEALPSLPASRRYTLGGCQIVYSSKTRSILVCREPAAVHPATPLHSGTSMLWDERFTISYKGALPLLTVDSLGAAAAKQLHEQLRPSLPKVILSTLPALWHLETLVAVPHLSYSHPDFGDVECHVRFTPAKPLVATPFFSMNTNYNSAITEGYA